MSISYDLFTDSFLSKISEYELLELSEEDREKTVDGYLKRAITEFNRICVYDLLGNADDTERVFNVDIPNEDIDEIVDIITEGMVVQWLKPYLYKQELLETVLNTRDFTTYSPAEMLLRVGNTHAQAKKDYTQMIREYSYNHGDLSELHL